MSDHPNLLRRRGRHNPVSTALMAIGFVLILVGAWLIYDRASYVVLVIGVVVMLLGNFAKLLHSGRGRA